MIFCQIILTTFSQGKHLKDLAFTCSVAAGVSAVSVGFDTSTLNHKKSTLLQLHKKENPSIHRRKYDVSLCEKTGEIQPICHNLAFIFQSPLVPVFYDCKSLPLELYHLQSSQSRCYFFNKCSLN